MDKIKSLLVLPNLESPMNPEAAQDYKNGTWAQKAKQTTQTYAKWSVMVSTIKKSICYQMLRIVESFDEAYFFLLIKKIISSTICLSYLFSSSILFYLFRFFNFHFRKIYIVYLIVYPTYL